MVLEDGNVDDLIHETRHDHGEMRAIAAIVAPRMFGSAKAHRGEHVGIVAGDMAGHLRRTYVAAPVEAGDVELCIAVTVCRRIPAHARQLALDQFQIAGIFKLIGVSLEDNNVLRFETDFAETLDDLDQHGGAGDGTDGIGIASPFARQRLTANRVDLDTDDLPFLEKSPPSTAYIARLRAGQHCHAAIDHALDGGRIDGV